MKLDQQDFESANAYHARLFGDLWNPITLSECDHDDNKRLTYKLMLNSLSGTWGKKEQYEQVHTCKQGLVTNKLFDKLNTNKITDLELIHDFGGHIHASYYAYCPRQVTGGTNVSLIGFISSYLRIHLHRHLSKIDYANLLYCDTDSMYMVCKKGSPDPFETSKKITGYFKLEHSGMKQWSSLGPNMYGLSASPAQADGADKVYADGSNSVYAESADEVYVRAKGFRIDKGFLDKSDFDALLPTKENVNNSTKGLMDGDITECSIRQTCLRGQRNGNIAVRNDFIKYFNSLQCLSHIRVLDEDGSTSPICV